MSELELRRKCEIHFPGHRPRSPAEDFSAMAQWCEENQVGHDVYGEGELLQAFEQKLSSLLGFEAGLFVISGTMAQVTALRIACAERGSRLVAMHPSSHILLHENSNFQLLDHFHALQIGSPYRPWTANDLTAIPDRLGAVIQELPMREIGGQLPDWDELEKIKAHCRTQNIHLHMDGARLWESAAAYGRSYQEIASGFDSVYVSMYKGINGLGGAVLCGSQAFIAKARVWMARQGGNLVNRSPYVVSAAMQFDERLAAMPAYFRRTEWLYQVLREFPRLLVNPTRPQSNMLHVHLPVARERALAIRNALAEQHGIWLFGRASHAMLPERSYIEWYVGDNLLNMPDQQVRDILNLFDAALKT